MRLYQTWKNYLAQLVLQADPPVLARLFRRWLVNLHTEFFLAAAERDAQAREAHLRALFDATIDMYLQALREGYPEAEAREITHVVGTFDFAAHGWGEYLEYPPDERGAYHERYRGFYERHGVTIEGPLGEFAPEGGLPAAPETPERMDGTYPLADAGLTDEVYTIGEDVHTRPEFPEESALERHT